MISGLFHLSGITALASERIMSEDALYYNIHDTVIRMHVTACTLGALQMCILFNCHLYPVQPVKLCNTVHSSMEEQPVVLLTG